MNVWRIGSRWNDEGAAGTTIIDIFIDYRVLFIGTDKSYADNICEGDLFAVTDGYAVVALAKALSRFKPLSNFGLNFSTEAENRCNPSGQTGCLAHIILLEKEDHLRHECRNSLCRAPQISEQVAKLWDKYTKEKPAKTVFDITSKKYVVDGGVSESLLAQHISYCVPIYQRPYSWGDREIRRFLTDMYRAVRDNPKAPEPIFGGTMQLSEPLALSTDSTLVRYDIVDGQQRITTLILTAQVLRTKFGVAVKNYSGKLRTLVNRGAAQIDYDEAIKAVDENTCDKLAEQNVYAANLRTICSILQEFDGELEENADSSAFLAEFAKFMLTSVYFVVIETHAGISKTLQIFNAINTSGLDLNGTDLFKIRFYEFLTAKRGEPQNAFDAISDLYKEIEERNRRHKSTVSSMGEILSMLQPVIVAKYGLSLGLMDYERDRFYGQLFDMLLIIYKWKENWQEFNHAKMDTIVTDKDGPLSVGGIRRLIEHRYQNHIDCDPANGTLETVAMTNLASCSRYSRYWFYPILFAYRFGESSQVATYRKELVKLLLTYSLIHAKSVYPIHACVQVSCQKLFAADASPETVMASIRAKRLEAKASCDGAIRGNDIAGNPKWKNILCRLSELLAHSPDEWAVPNAQVIKNVFSNSNDIEHIQSYHDKDGKQRDEIWEEWGHVLNGIGNLVILESSINRSIGNERFDVKTNAARDLSYHKSIHRNVHRLVEESCGTWTKEQCEARRDTEAAKLLAFLFS